VLAPRTRGWQVLLVDDDDSLRRALARTIKRAGFGVDAYASVESLLAEGVPERDACLVLDVDLHQAVREQRGVLAHRERLRPDRNRLAVPLGRRALTRPGDQPMTSSRRVLRYAAPLAFLLVVSAALGQEQLHPLQPPDRSSPRAALKTFLESGDALAAFLAQDYLPSPSPARFRRLLSLGEIPSIIWTRARCPRRAREKTSRAATVAL
jgi:hypothetical protein